MDEPRGHYAKSDRKRQIPYDLTYMWNLEKQNRDFPGGPVVKTLLSNAGGAGLIPGQGAKNTHTVPG